MRRGKTWGKFSIDKLEGRLLIDGIWLVSDELIGRAKRVIDGL
jgi:hypothetical protein